MKIETINGQDRKGAAGLSEAPLTDSPEVLARMQEFSLKIEGPGSKGTRVHEHDEGKGLQKEYDGLMIQEVNNHLASVLSPSIRVRIDERDVREPEFSLPPGKSLPRGGYGSHYLDLFVNDRFLFPFPVGYNPARTAEEVLNTLDIEGKDPWGLRQQLSNEKPT